MSEEEGVGGRAREGWWCVGCGLRVMRVSWSVGIVAELSSGARERNGNGDRQRDGFGRVRASMTIGSGAEMEGASELSGGCLGASGSACEGWVCGGVRGGLVGLRETGCASSLRSYRLVVDRDEMEKFSSIFNYMRGVFQLEFEAQG